MNIVYDAMITKIFIISYYHFLVNYFRRNINIDLLWFQSSWSQNSASVSIFVPPKHDVVPIASPAQPRPVKKRRRARRLKNRSQNLQQPKGIWSNRKSLTNRALVISMEHIHEKYIQQTQIEHSILPPTPM